MPFQSIATVVVDEKTGGRWHVCAYRSLTTLEAHEAIEHFCMGHRARPARDQVITIRARVESPSDLRSAFVGEAA